MGMLIGGLSRMIVVRIVGGLGNQLFQYTMAKALAVKHNVQIGVDATSLKGRDKEGHFRRKFKLNRLNVDFEEIPLKKIRKYIWITGNKYIDDPIIRRFRLFEKNVWRDNGIIKDFNKLPNDIYLDGYFGNPDYLKGLHKILQKEIRLRDTKPIKEILKSVKSSNSVSIHVRRGDLLKLENSYILPLNYYKQAIKIITKKIKNPKYYIFSDDINWCKKKFNFLKNTCFVEGYDVTQDFELMKNCKHNILANSSLSWWVGYLNSNRNSIIIAPKHFGVWKIHPGKEPSLKKWIVI